MTEKRRHTKEELDGLRRFTVPTLANAIETFAVIPSNEGGCDGRMKCRFPQMPLMLGYATTARVSTDQQPSEVRPGIHEPDYWHWIADQPGPKVAVVQDIDTPSKGAMWGEWNSNVHKALGCVGMVTDGGCRDLDGVVKLNFHFFSTEVLPTHGCGYFIDYGGAVRVAGMVIQTGNLLAGDQHGVILIPDAIDLKELARVAAEIDRLESEIFTFCQSKDFSVDGLEKVNESVNSRWPQPVGSAKKFEVR